MLRNVALISVSAVAVATAQASLLQIVTNGAGQQIEVVIGPVPGEVVVTGVNGGSSVPYVGVTAISLTTGGGQDYVEFRVDTTVIPDITLNTGGGISDVKFIYEVPFTTAAVVSNVSVTGGSVHDAVDFSVLASGDNFTGNWNVSHAGGDNTSTATVNLPDPSAALSINYAGTSGAGQDNLGLSLISNAANLNLSVSGMMGGGNDTATVVIDGLSPAAMAASFNLNMGAGDDAASVEVISRGGTVSASGSILGGNNVDALTLKIEGDGVISTSMNGGAGSDLVDMSLKGVLTGAPTLLGAGGDDELKIVVDGPQLATPFIDGGPGIDKAIGFGTIVNVEQIN